MAERGGKIRHFGYFFREGICFCKGHNI
jgi:hypothetical protein